MIEEKEENKIIFLLFFLNNQIKVTKQYQQKTIFSSNKATNQIK